MTEHTMDADGGKKLGNLTVLDGGKAHERRTHAEVELDRAMRALFYAMRSKHGGSVNKNFRNVACGVTHPWRAIVRRLREARRARNPSVNYPLAKATVRELDRYVDRLYGKESANTTGDHPRAA